MRGPGLYAPGSISHWMPAALGRECGLGRGSWLQPRQFPKGCSRGLSSPSCGATGPSFLKENLGSTAGALFAHGAGCDLRESLDLLLVVSNLVWTRGGVTSLTWDGGMSCPSNLPQNPSVLGASVLCSAEDPATFNLTGDPLLVVSSLQSRIPAALTCDGRTCFPFTEHLSARDFTSVISNGHSKPVMQVLSPLTKGEPKLREVTLAQGHKAINSMVGGQDCLRSRQGGKRKTPFLYTFYSLLTPNL